MHVIIVAKHAYTIIYFNSSFTIVYIKMPTSVRIFFYHVT